MLSGGQGGLEQSMLDYCGALATEGHRVMAITHPDWPGLEGLGRLPVQVADCRTLGEWDPLAVLRLKKLLRLARSDIVLTIGRRASGLTRRALSGVFNLPQVAVTPNYSFDQLIGLDHVLATTAHLRRSLIAAGQPADRVTVVPNMVQVPEYAAPVAPEPVELPVIGALGRFVPKKGFVQLIEALALLRARDHSFSMCLAGSGPEEASLRASVAQRGLADRITFLGWITDKRRFFESVDIFCVPSLHEPFGIVVLEGFAFGRASVVTDAEGPSQIARHGVDALVVPRGDPARLADGLASLLDDPNLRHRLGRAALAIARERYEQKVVARQISCVLRRIVRERQLVAAGVHG